ncbi:MAG: alpha/beta hydrolase [Actinomycetota bacterium]
MPSLPWRTALFCLLAQRFQRSPADLRLDQIQRARHSSLPHVGPVGWLLGKAPRTVQIKQEFGPTRSGPVSIRWYVPPRRSTSTPLVVFFHGGGWVTGNVRSRDPICARIAWRANTLVASVGYRQAPEHPFPAAVHDSIDITEWLIRSAEDVGADPKRVALMGDSAGGNLAAVTAQHLRDRGVPLSAQVLIYPATDATLASASVAQFAHGPLLTRRMIDGYLACYAPSVPRTNPQLSPLHAADLSGLASALVITAGRDPLRDDGVRYADAMRQAGVRVLHRDYPRLPHGFLSVPGVIPHGKQPLVEIAAFLRKSWGTSLPPLVHDLK